MRASLTFRFYQWEEGKKVESPHTSQTKFFFDLSMNLYTITKTDESIINEQIEKINFNGKAWVEGTDLGVLDTLPSNITSFESVYDITWYPEKDGCLPVFGMKLKLELAR